MTHSPQVNAGGKLADLAALDNMINQQLVSFYPMPLLFPRALSPQPVFPLVRSARLSALASPALLMLMFPCVQNQGPIVQPGFAFLAFLGCAIGGALVAFLTSYMVPSLVEGYAVVSCCCCAPPLTLLLQVSEDARSRYGAADQSCQPAAVQAFQQPRVICACTIVRL